MSSNNRIVSTARRIAVFNENAPAPARELSQAIKVGDMVFCSGAIAINPDTGNIVEGSFQGRVRRCLVNLESVLIAAGCDFEDVVKVNVFLTDMNNLEEMNEAYYNAVNRSCMGGHPVAKPARTCVAVSQLPLGTDVMIDCIAFQGPTGSKESVSRTASPEIEVSVKVEEPMVRVSLDEIKAEH